MTEVVAALIWDGNRFMACQRPAHKARGLKWEFVGGKVEPGETKEQALIRECREELAVTVSVGKVFMDVVHQYPDLTVHLTLFHAAIAEGVPQKLEHNDIRWLTVEEIGQYEFCPADAVILDRLRREGRSVEQAVQARLFAMQDLKYRDFHSRLMPTVDRETVIGVRTPELRKFARAFAKTPEAAAFLQILPHTYYEENNLHGFLIENMKDYSQVIAALDVFLPYVDNWATCDLMRPKVFAKHLPELRARIPVWMASGHTYTIRFGMEMLMTYFLDQAFQPEYLEWAAQVNSSEYYVNMMTAWYFATALAKQYAAALPYLERRRLAPWTHNKAIQKAIESDRITAAQKAYLRTLKVRPERRNPALSGEAL